MRPSRIALVALFVAAIGCTTGPVADPDGELHILGAEPALHHLDPQQATAKTEVGEVSLLFDTLLTYDRSGRTLIPALAEALPDVSSDGLRYTVRLRADLTYSDGRPLVAGDFVFAFRHLCDPATKSDFAFAGYVVEGCERFHGDEPGRTPPDQVARDRDAVGVIAVDPRTITYRLTARAAYFSHLLASWLTAPTRGDLVAQGDAWTEPGSLIGNGLFRLVSWDHRKQMVFERNDQHRPKAKLRRIVMQLALAPAAALAFYRNGELDVVGVGADLKREVDADPALVQQARAGDSLCTTYVNLNVRRPPFDDGAVRLAFAKSIDRDRWVRDSLAGLAAPLDTFVPPGMAGYDKDDDAQTFDPVKARGLLAGSRYAASMPPIQLTYAPDPTALRVFQPLLDDWRANLGVDVRLAPIDATTARDLLRPETSPQMVLQGWCAAYPDPQDFLSLVFVSNTGVGHTNYANPAYDALVRRGDVESDTATRMNLYRDAQRLLTREAPAIFLSYARSFTLVSPRVHGASLTPLDRVFSQFTLTDVFVPRAGG